MYTLKVKNHRGNSLMLTNNPCYTVYRVDGLTPPAAIINSSVNATTDGSSVNSVRVESRNIVIYMTIKGEVEKNRINLYKYFPLKKSVTLYYTNDSRDVFIEGVVESIECDPFANKQIAQISILCPKVYFNDMKSLITEFSTINKNLEFPFSIEENGVEFSSISTEVRKSIVNAGEVETGVIIELYATGDVENPVIYDVLKGTHMSINFLMRKNDKIIINTNVGEKSITLWANGVSQNLIGAMIKTSSWFKLETGDNVFTYDCDSGITDLHLTFTSRLLYGGV